MPPLILAIRWLHIGAGFLAFFVAPVAMIVAKGSDRHRFWGKIYFYAMAMATMAALIVAAWRPNFFLLGLSVFSFHLCFVGYRVLFRKRPERDPAKLVDWLVTILNVACGVLLIYRGFSSQWGGQILFFIFGAGMIANSISVIVIYVSKNRPKNSWFFDHMTGMLASYIAAVTAFSAVNFTFLPIVVQWLWPTVVGAPLITIWVTKYKSKFAKGVSPKDVATIKIGA
ncbi:MAG TPA: hypothetical protein VEW28_08840 [Candidatus Kapabacteria bacterium]|nr:hypothetical protein [Candidatus Kapabacteria bacterium]